MNQRPLKPGWKLVKFGEFVENIVEQGQPTTEDSRKYIGLEHLDSGSLHVKRWGSDADLKGKKLVMKKGDLLFAKRNAYLRRVAIAPYDGFFSAHGMILRPKGNDVLQEFLPFFLQSDLFMERAIEISVGSLSPTINWNTLRVEELPLPPLDEQKRISEILWAADEAVERNVLLKNAFHAFYMSSIETYCFDKRHNAVKIEKIADINKETLSVLKTAKNYQFKYLDIGSVLAPKEIGKLAIYNFSDAPSRARRVVRDFDILLSTVRPNLQSFIRIGKVGRELIASTGFAVISPMNYALGSIVFHSFFSKRFSQYCDAKVTGTSYPAVTAKDIGMFTIFIPSEKNEIHRIAKILDSIDQSIRQIESCICAGKEMNKVLIDELIGRGAPHV
ncbi:MAG: hypothetical protein FDX30_02865 [Chlorobium sp.]|nr:MAG: hypothetical protein FDX30_02865 [Chlorobium sp.]